MAETGQEVKIDFRRQRSELERETQAALGRLREAAARERRLRELPAVGLPRSGIAQQIAEVEQRRAEALRELSEAEAKEKTYQEALEAVKPYKVEGTEDQYKLEEALREGVDRSYLNLVFGKDAVAKTSKYLEAVKELEPYKKGENKYDIAGALEGKKVTTEHLELLGISKEAISKAQAELPKPPSAERQAQIQEKTADLKAKMQSLANPLLIAERVGGAFERRLASSKEQAQKMLDNWPKNISRWMFPNLTNEQFQKLSEDYYWDSGSWSLVPRTQVERMAKGEIMRGVYGFTTPEQARKEIEEGILRSDNLQRLAYLEGILKLEAELSGKRFTPLSASGAVAVVESAPGASAAIIPPDLYTVPDKETHRLAIEASKGNPKGDPEVARYLKAVTSGESGATAVGIAKGLRIDAYRNASGNIVWATREQSKTMQAGGAESYQVALDLGLVAAPPVVQLGVPLPRMDKTDLVQVKDGYISRVDYDALSTSDQKLLVSVGVDAYNKQKQDEYEKELVKEYGSPWMIATPEGLRAFKEALQAGESAPEAIRKAQVAGATASFLKANVKITAGGEEIFIDKNYYDSLSPANKALLANIGFDAFTAEIQKRLAGLDNYKTKDEKTGGYSYDIAGFLRENPQVKADTLVAAGFGKEDIGRAVEYNQQPFVAYTPGEDFYKAVKAAGGADLYRGITALIVSPVAVAKWREFLSEHPEIKKLYEAARTHTGEALSPSLSSGAFGEAFIAARNIDPDSKEARVYKQLANLEYQRLYGAGALAESMGVGVSSALFSPARVLYPEVTAKDISGLEWGIGAAQVAFIATGVGGLAAKGLSIPALTMLRSTQIAASAFLTPVGVYGTIKNWGEMSPTERGVSIAFDIIVAIPLVMGGVSAAKILARKVDPLGVAARDLLKAENAANKAFAKNLKDAYGSEVADKFRVVNRAQADYINQLVKLEKLESVKIPSATQIKVATSEAGALERRLFRVATEYVNSLKKATAEISTGKYQLVRVVDKAGNLVKYERAPMPKGKVEVGVGFDSPTVARMLDDLPREIARNARSIVKSLRPSKAEIARLQADVLRTATRLREAQEKFPDDPSKWSDLIYDNAIAQSKLAQAQMGSVVKLQEQLLEIRGRLPKATEAELRQLSALERRLKAATSDAEITRLETQISELSTKIYNSRLTRAPANLRAEIYKLEAELAKTIKSMEVEWGRGGPITRGRGRVAVGVRPPTAGDGASATAVRAATEEMILKEMASRARDYGEILDARAVYTPWGAFVVVYEPKPEMPDIIITEPHLLVKTKTLPKPEVEPKIEPEVKPEAPPIHPSVEPSPYPVRKPTPYPIVKPAPYPEIKPYVWPEPEAEPFTRGVYFGVDLQVHPITKAAIKAQAEANTKFLEELKTATQSAVKTATKLVTAGKTGTALQTAVATSVSTQIKNLTKVQPALRAQLLMQVQPITKLATQMATEVATKVAARVKPVEPIIPIKVKLPDGTKHTLTKEELAGTVAWKQGFIFKHLFPPYGENNAFNTRKPIPGVPVYSGPESAYRSIVRLGGKVPPEIKRDMGIMDVVIRTAPGGKPKLQFIPDVKQKTKLTRRHKPKRKRVGSEPVLMSAR